ncbi:hypothetical protein U1Q18_031150 [Sarracenia purpurea var. burkii]
MRRSAAASHINDLFWSFRDRSSLRFLEPPSLSTHLPKDSERVIFVMESSHTSASHISDPVDCQEVNHMASTRTNHARTSTVLPHKSKDPLPSSPSEYKSSLEDSHEKYPGKIFLCVKEFRLNDHPRKGSGFAAYFSKSTAAADLTDLFTSRLRLLFGDDESTTTASPSLHKWLSEYSSIDKLGFLISCYV